MYYPKAYLAEDPYSIVAPFFLLVVVVAGTQRTCLQKYYYLTTL